MSGKLVGEVYEKQVDGMAQRVLLAMADHAQDDGSHCFPSIMRLAWKIGCHEKTIRRTIQDLETQGVLVVDRQTGRVNEYRIVLAAIANKEPFNGLHGRPKKPRTFENTEAKNPGHLEPKTPDISDKTPDILSLTTDIQMSAEPLTVNLEPSEVNRHSARDARRGKMTPYPDDFKVSESMYEWALEKHQLPIGAVDRETEQFTNHHLAKGTKFVDWNRAWMTWIGNASNWSKERAGGRAGSGTGKTRAEDPDRRNWDASKWFED